MNRRFSLPWLRSAPYDLAWVIGPSWLVSVLALLLPAWAGSRVPLDPMTWLVLVVFLDVAHVYMTLYRTYLDPRERVAHPNLLLFVPLTCWAIASAVHSLSPGAFWTAVAYTAVFHFIRQQYGLMMLYSTPADREDRTAARVDGLAIWAATLYPLVYWHTHLPRAFVWFTDGDFLPLPGSVEPVARVAYAGVGLAYIVRVVRALRRGDRLNIPRHAIICGTALSWYVAIVAYDSDMAFSAVNIVSHAIPYFALVWLYGANRESRLQATTRLYRWQFVPVLVSAVFLLAYLEEGLWDGLVWKEHGMLFSWATALPELGKSARDLLVPMLMLPQLTHYVLDGFIWRLRGDAVWRETTLYRRRAASI